jgi:hypothetical protein
MWWWRRRRRRSRRRRPGQVEPYHSDVEAHWLGLVMWPLVITAWVLFAAEALRAPRPGPGAYTRSLFSST